MNSSSFDNFFWIFLNGLKEILENHHVRYFATLKFVKLHHRRQTSLALEVDSIQVSTYEFKLI